MGSAGMARAAPASMEVIPLNTLEVLCVLRQVSDLYLDVQRQGR